MKPFFSHHLSPPTSAMIHRAVSIFCVFCAFFTLLYLRISMIQADSEYTQVGKTQSSYTVTIPTERATIFDTKLNPLTNQDYLYYATVLPNQENIKLLKEHAVLLTEKELDEKLAEARPFVCEVDTYELTEENLQVFAVHDRYAGQQLATHIIGYLDGENKGVAGLEKAYDDRFIQGVLPTEITYTVDGIGHGLQKIEPQINYGSLPNSHVVLTLDSEIQRICEKIGQNHIKKGAVVVMEVDTGKIRAMCSFPNYQRDSLGTAVADEENSPMLNRALNPTAVGSTFKVVTAAVALEQGISENETYTCNGAYSLGTQQFGCHKAQGHGTLNLQDALKESCNPYFVHLALQVEPKNLIQAANDFGFGKKTELAPFLYSRSGTLPSLASLNNDSGQVANFSFGQGAFTATPVQVAQMMSTIANDGYTPIPMLVEGFSSDGKSLSETNATSGMQAIDKSIAQILKKDLIRCVMENEGQNATPKTTTAGGKTATAQTGIFVEEEELNNGWFAGFFPAEQPRYAVVVLSEEATYGNENAAPVFQEIADSITVLEQD